MIEITAGDFTQIEKLFAALERIGAECNQALQQIELHVTLDGQTYVIGYGESAEPAILSVEGPK